ncbi:MAG: STAS domain-containing protein [Rariglobus sp.]
MPANQTLIEIISKDQASLIAEWVKTQQSSFSQQGLISQDELQKQCSQFIHLLLAAPLNTRFDTGSQHWADLRDFLTEISASRGQQGFTPTETALFVFSLKAPLFNRLRSAAGKDADALATSVLEASNLLDDLGLFTTNSYQKTREEVIRRQQQDLLELSTPVVKLWDGILALPLVGTLDSARTQVVMESLLQKIVDTGSDVAIIDITGVPTVDTLVAQHLLKTITAARLMGADCIISGVRPQIAQTIVHLGVNLGEVSTKANLADAFRLALERTKQTGFGKKA